jgi:hypothetical protein
VAQGEDPEFKPRYHKKKIICGIGIILIFLYIFSNNEKREIRDLVPCKYRH